MIVHSEGVWALKQAPQGSEHSTNPVRVQEEFGQLSQTHGVIPRVVPCRTLMILVDPFQARIFCDSAILTILFSILFLRKIQAITSLKDCLGK